MVSAHDIIPVLLDLRLYGLRGPWDGAAEMGQLAQLWEETLPASWTLADLKAAVRAYVATPKGADASGQVYALPWPTPGHLIAAHRASGQPRVLDLDEEFGALLALALGTVGRPELDLPAFAVFEQRLIRRYGSYTPAAIDRGLAACGGFTGLRARGQACRDAFIQGAAAAVYAGTPELRAPGATRPIAYSGVPELKLLTGGLGVEAQELESLLRRTGAERPQAAPQRVGRARYGEGEAGIAAHDEAMLAGLQRELKR